MLQLPRKIFALMLIVSLAGLSLAACEKKEGPAEKVGRNVDEAYSDAAEEVEEAGEAIEEAADDAAESMEETYEDAADAAAGNP